MLAADEFEYKPPGEVYVMEAHFNWCAEGKTPAVKLERYKRFWSLQKPADPDGYDDSRHIRHVRRCAYRLAELYAPTVQTKDCIKMLKWLEKDDDTFEVEKPD